MNKIAIIHGTWVPDPVNLKDWELAVTPIVQTYSNSNCTRYIPEGHFSLINLSDDTDLEKALSNLYAASIQIKDFVAVAGSDRVKTLWGMTEPSKLTMHNLGSLDDDGEEYDVYLMIPSSITTSLRDRCFEWDGMQRLSDIKVGEDEKLELAVISLLRQVRFGE